MIIIGFQRPVNHVGKQLERVSTKLMNIFIDHTNVLARITMNHMYADSAEHSTTLPAVHTHSYTVLDALLGNFVKQEQK